uniref:Uncharacterized protein n=1 Tax=Kalanchoe fedtschenkoi TaxID=63787 RepID=A0A7N0U559_KALFE
MSNAADDERTLLRDIKRRLGEYPLEPCISHRIYLIASFIFKSVTAHRLDATEMALPSVLEESTEAELDFIKSDFIDIGNILRERLNVQSLLKRINTCLGSPYRAYFEDSFTQ